MQGASIKKTNIFNEKQVHNFAGYFSTLSRIHSRLVQERYIIKDGKIFKPKVTESKATEVSIQNVYEK